MRSVLLLCALYLTACTKKEPTQVSAATVPVDPGSFVLPEGHPAIDTPGALAQSTGPRPANGSGHTPTRVNVDQLRAALLVATGKVWVGRLVVADPSSPTGNSLVDNADMLEAFANSLGRPDFRTSVNEDHEPGLTFSKLASDAARFTCRAGIAADVLEADETKRFILRRASAGDTLAAQPAAIRDNIVELGLTFWGRVLEPTSPEVEKLLRVFEVVSTAPASRDDGGTTRSAGPPLDGWRVVCIAMATDTRFLSY